MSLADFTIGLQWPDLDLRNRFISVRRQYKDGDHSRTKTKKMRKVDISDVLLDELKAFKKRRQEEYLGRGKNEIRRVYSSAPD